MYTTGAPPPARWLSPLPSRPARAPLTSGAPQQRGTYLWPPRRSSGGRGCRGHALDAPSRGRERVGAPPRTRRRGHGHCVQGYRREKKAAPGGGCTQRVRGRRHSQRVAHILHKPLRQDGVGSQRHVGAKQGEPDTEEAGTTSDTHVRKGVGRTDWTTFAHNFTGSKE